MFKNLKISAQYYIYQIHGRCDQFTEGQGGSDCRRVPNAQQSIQDTSGVPIYVGYAQQVAQQTSVSYVDHFDLVLKEYEALGATTVNGYFPIDNIHTNTVGADVVAQALVRGILCDSTNPLLPYIENSNVQPGE